MEKKSNGKEYFEFKLDVLKIELEQINDIVGRIDTITQATKNWTVAIWSGGIALALSSNDVELKKFIILTAAVPLLFWFIDANFRRRQRKFLYRSGKISDFLNSENLKKSFDEKDIVNFHILDPIGRKHKNEPELEEFADLFRAFKFRSLRYFYLGLIAISLILGSVFWVQSIKGKNIKSELTKTSNSQIDSLMKENHSLRLEIDAIKKEMIKEKPAANKVQNGK